MKKLGEAFNGRSRAYLEALDGGDDAPLAATLARNVLGTAEPAWGLGSYVRQSEVELAGFDLERLLAEGPRFARPQAFDRGVRP
jgi:cytochrome b pre-mRNA-processing protein 3